MSSSDHPCSHSQSISWNKLERNISWNNFQLCCTYNNLHWTALTVNFAAPLGGPTTRALRQKGATLRSLLVEGNEKKKKREQQGILLLWFFSLDTFLKRRQRRPSNTSNQDLSNRSMALVFTLGLCILVWWDSPSILVRKCHVSRALVLLMIFSPSDWRVST